METEKLTLRIESISDSNVNCCASNYTYKTYFSYNYHQKKLFFNESNYITKVIHKYKFQFDKVLQSAIRGKIKNGQIINCVFIDGFKFLDETDYNRFICLDQRNGNLLISSCDDIKENIYNIYTDGSFASETNTSGFGEIIKDSNGKKEVIYRSFPGGSSNLMELLPVLDAIKRLRHVEIIQINTDSRFVIRGMVQWMHFWRHNNWQTAFGKQVKFIEYWQQLYKLSQNKLIIFKWIKGHSGHVEQEFCHKLARKSANNT